VRRRLDIGGVSGEGKDQKIPSEYGKGKGIGETEVSFQRGSRRNRGKNRWRQLRPYQKGYRDSRTGSRGRRRESKGNMPNIRVRIVLCQEGHEKGKKDTTRRRIDLKAKRGKRRGGKKIVLEKRKLRWDRTKEHNGEGQRATRNGNLHEGGRRKPNLVRTYKGNSQERKPKSMRP